MEEALQRRVQRYGWDKAADYYESSWQKQLLPAQQKLLAFANIQPGENIADIACGTSLLSFEAAALTGDEGFVTANDISGKMIDIARAAAAARLVAHIRFERMDAEHLQLDDNIFDAALCGLGLMYFPNPRRALKEMRRVLKKHSRVAITVWGKRTACGWAGVFDIIEKRVSSEVCPLFFQLGKENVLANCLSIAGFGCIKTERFDTILEYKNEDEACLAAFDGGPVALAYQRFSPQIKLAVREEYLQSIRQFRYGNGYKVPGQFVVASGEKS